MFFSNINKDEEYDDNQLKKYFDWSKFDYNLDEKDQESVSEKQKEEE